MRTLSILASSATIEAEGNEVSVDLQFTSNRERLAVLDGFLIEETVEHFGAYQLLDKMDLTDITRYLEEEWGYEITSNDSE